MTAANSLSVVVSNADAKPRIPNQSWQSGAEDQTLAATVECLSTDADGSTYRMFRVPSGARIVSLKWAFDAMSGFTSAGLGVYKTAADGGAAVSAALFSATVDVHAGLGFTDATYGALDIAKCNGRLWEMLGLSTDPFLEYDIVITGTTRGSATGTISMLGTFVV